ncbi:CotH kinase family protein [Verrucomicrobiaceae bacterium 227]
MNFPLPSIICAIIGVTGLSCFTAFADAPRTNPDADFWQSVYQENHVVKIDISLTKEAWEKMQPAQNTGGRGERGDRPPRSGDRAEGPPPRGERGERPERGGRPGGPPPGGGPGGPGGGTNFEYVKASLTVDGEPLKDIGLRFKGNSSYRAAAGSDKRPLKIDTNRFVSGQKLHGRTKFNLSTSFQDPAFMKEKLAYEVYHAAGLPTPGTGWAKVTLSVEGVMEKKDLGIYVVIEQVDENFLARQLGEKSKNSLLMKPDTTANWQSPGEDPALYEDAFGIKEGADNQDQIRQFADFLSLINESPEATFAKEIGQKMDLDLYAGYLAATSALASLDSYVAAPHNYYLVLDKADSKVRLLPWDVNEAFGTHTMGTSPQELVKWDITRPWTREIPLLERLFATSQFRELYQKKLTNLMKETFTEEHLFSRIATFENALKPHLSKTELADFRTGLEGSLPGKNSTSDQGALAIKPFIQRRIASITSQLTGKSKGTKIEERQGRPGPGRRAEAPQDRPRK